MSFGIQVYEFFFFFIYKVMTLIVIQEYDPTKFRCVLLFQSIYKVLIVRQEMWYKVNRQTPET